MNLAHVHLLLNHWPIIGTIFGLGLLLVSLAGKSADLKRASLVVFVLIALFSMPVYVSGNGAEEMIDNVEGVSKATMETHRDAAFVAFVFMQITGLFAWLGLWQYRRTSRQAQWNVLAVLLFSLITVGLMTRTGNTGGEIRHPEIAPVQEAVTNWADIAEAAKPGISASVGLYVIGNKWRWAMTEDFHFLGMGLLFGVVLLLDLRMLGLMKSISFASLHRLLPWAILGFTVNLITGMWFFFSGPELYTRNFAFYWKIGLLVLVGINVLYLTVADRAWAVGPGDDAPLRVKFIAGSTILLTAGVAFFGRMLPFLGVEF